MHELPGVARLICDLLKRIAVDQIGPNTIQDHRGAKAPVGQGRRIRNPYEDTANDRDEGVTSFLLVIQGLGKE